MKMRGMGMTTGSLLAETAYRVAGTFAPPGQAGSLSNAVIKQASNQQANFTFGTDDSQVDTIVFQDRVLAAGASATYDIYTGRDLLDINSGTAAFRTVRYLSVFVVDDGDTSGVRVGGAASNEFLGWFVSAGDQQDVFPNGAPLQQGDPIGKTVSSSNKNIKIANLGAVPVTVRIVIGGTVQVPGGLMGILGLTYP